jgi:P27 family predicted phage terminase small subunit
LTNDEASMSRKLPTAIHEQKGTARSDRQKPDEPKPPVGVPVMPAHLNDEEKVAWHYCVEILEPMGVLTRADGLALEQLATAIVEVRYLHEQLRVNKTQAVLSTQKEVVDRLNPLYPMYQQSRKELRSLWSAFGLDPLSRTNVHTVQGRSSKADGSGQGKQAPAKPASAYFSH